MKFIILIRSHFKNKNLTKKLKDKRLKSWVTNIDVDKNLKE